MKILKNLIIMSLKKDVSVNKNNVIKNIKEHIILLKLKFMPRGRLKSTIANYKNGDEKLTDVIGKLTSFSIPFFLATITISLSVKMILNGMLIFCIPLILFTFLIFLLGCCVFYMKSKTIAEENLDFYNKEIKKIEKRTMEINKIIENVFKENKKAELENVSLSFGNEKDKLFIFDRLINIEVLNEVKKSFSKRQIIELLKMTDSENIKYIDLINFIHWIERDGKANNLYKKMFSNEKENIEKMIKQEILL